MATQVGVLCTTEWTLVFDDAAGFDGGVQSSALTVINITESTPAGFGGILINSEPVPIEIFPGEKLYARSYTGQSVVTVG